MKKFIVAALMLALAVPAFAAEAPKAVEAPKAPIAAKAPEKKEAPKAPVKKEALKKEAVKPKLSIAKPTVEMKK